MDPVAVSAARDSTEIILQYGIGGVFLLTSMAVNVLLWRTNVGLTNQLAKLQEARLADVKEVTTTLVKASESIQGNTEGLKGVQTALTNFTTVLEPRRR